MTSVLPQHVWVTHEGTTYCTHCLMRPSNPMSRGPCDQLLSRVLSRKEETDEGEVEGR